MATDRGKWTVPRHADTYRSDQNAITRKVGDKVLGTRGSRTGEKVEIWG